MRHLLLCLLLLSCRSSGRKKENEFPHGVVSLPERVEQRLSEAQVIRGKKLYREHCLSCHGEQGKGDGPLAEGQRRKPADLERLAKSTKNFMFFISISQWDRRMPGWKESFTYGEREDLTAYIKSFAHK